MPLKSQAQEEWLRINKPELAKEFEAATPKGTKLPKHVKPKAKPKGKKKT